MKVDADITRFHKFRLKVCFSESARKMMQNGGRVVAIGSIFDILIYFCNLEDIRKNGDQRRVGEVYLEAQGHDCDIRKSILVSILHETHVQGGMYPPPYTTE